MADELIDIYDENNRSLDVRKMKSEAHRDGLWHRAAHVWMYNNQGEILLQLRSIEKEQYPEMWDVSVAGHIGAGEEPRVAASREMAEEVGLSIDPIDLDFFKIEQIREVYKSIKNNGFEYVYFFRFDGDKNDLVLQKEEVEEIRLVHIDELERDLKRNPEKYVPHGKYWFEITGEVRRRLKTS